MPWVGYRSVMSDDQPPQPEPRAPREDDRPGDVGEHDFVEDEPGHPETGIRESNPNGGGPQGTAGGMGVSSERVGHTGPGQVSTDGTRPTSREKPEGDVPPEQRPGGPEPKPVGITPRQAPDPEDVGR